MSGNRCSRHARLEGPPAELTFTAGDPCHAAEAAKLVQSADPPFFGYVYGPDAPDRIADGWRKRDGLYSHRAAAVAMLNGRMIGLELGFAGDEAARRRCETARGLPPDRARRLDLALMLLPHVPAGAYYLQYLAVAPDFRGCRIGSRLLRRAVTRARQAGCWALHLDVEEGNRSERFYRLHGLETLCRNELSPGLVPGVNIRLQFDLARGEAVDDDSSNSVDAAALSAALVRASAPGSVTLASARQELVPKPADPCCANAERSETAACVAIGSKSSGAGSRSRSPTSEVRR